MQRRIPEHVILSYTETKTSQLVGIRWWHNITSEGTYLHTDTRGLMNDSNVFLLRNTTEARNAPTARFGCFIRIFTQPEVPQFPTSVQIC
jgi:hypothetical protein